MSGTGQVIFYDHGTIRTSDNYTLDASAHNGLDFPVQAALSGGDCAGSWSALSALCSMFAEVHKEKEGVRFQLDHKSGRNGSQGLQKPAINSRERLPCHMDPISRRLTSNPRS